MSALLRKYGAATTIVFPLLDATTYDFKVDCSHASGDTTIMKDEGAEANTTNGFVDEGQGYSLTLTATEMEAARIVVYIVDQGTKVWKDQCVIVETYGHASAQHAFDLSVAVQSVDVTKISGDSTAADNAESFFDGTGYAGTNNTIPTVTNLTNLPSIPANWLTAAGIAADVTTELQSGLATAASIAALNNLSAADVWGYATRLLTGGDNIVLAKGTGITGLNDLSAAQVNAEVDTALADVGLTTTVTGRIDAAVSTRLASASYTAPDNASIMAILEDTGTTLPGTLATVGGYIDTEIGTIITNIAAVKSDTAAILLDTGTDGVVVASASKTGFALTSAYDFAKGNVAMTEAYPTAGATMTPIETLYSMHQLMAEQSITSTTLTAKKRDQSTTAKTYTLDSATTPTSITEV